MLMEPEFRDWPDVGIVASVSARDRGRLAQACLTGRAVAAPITIRLVKGAYWDYETTIARQLGWPVPVYQRKWESDACYERCTDFLLENRARG